jgi:WD40 repeat protein
MRRCKALFLFTCLIVGVSPGAAQRPQLVVQTGHSDDVYSVAFSPNGRILASGSVDNTIKLWDSASGSELRTLVGHHHVVASVTFSPDGLRLASGSQDGTVKIWDVASGRELQTLAGHRGYVNSVAFSPNGRTLASGGEDGMVKLWNAATGRELQTLTGHPHDVSSVAFSPDGRMLVSGGWQAVILWKVANGSREKTFSGGAFMSVAFSPDGKTFAAGEQSSIIRLWDVAKGTELRTIGAAGHSVSSIAFSPDGQILASSGTDKKIKLWSPADGRELRTMVAKDMFKSVVFSPNGKTLASGSYSKTVTLWDVATGQRLRDLTGHTKKVASVAFSPDGHTLAVGLWDDTVKIWDMASGREVRTLAGDSNRKASVAFSPDGQTLALGSANEIRLWDVATGRELQKLDAGLFNFVDSILFSSDGRFLASADYDSVEIWDAHSGSHLWTVNGKSGGMPIAFSPDGHMLAAGSDQDVEIWNVVSRTELRTLAGPGGKVWSVAFNSDGHTLASANRDNTITLWDIDSGKEIQSLEGHLGEQGHLAESMAFSPDGRTLVSASWDKTIQLWDVTAGRELLTIAQNLGPVSSVAFSPDGKLLASGDEGGMVRLWDGATGTELATLFSFDEGEWAVSDPDGRFDTNNLNEISGLSWVFPDEPYRPLAPEVFMRDYFQPRLLTTVSRGEVLPWVRSLSYVNRAQPQVDILKVEPEPGNGLVSVTVQVADNQSSMQKDKSGRLLHSGAYDLHLFRNGQVVGQWPEALISAEHVAGASAPQADWESWRRLREIRLAGGQTTHTFSHIRLPMRPAPDKIAFTAYAFNSDRVKSSTSHPYPFSLPSASVPPDPPRAYLVTMGVNANQSHNLDLELAVSSAERVRALVRTKLQATFSEVIETQLYSDFNENSNQLKVKTATKADLKTVLDLLAGRSVDIRLKDEVDPKHQLRAAGPDDEVVLYVASHGYADPQGSFYLIPYDTGSNWGVTEDVLTRCATKPGSSASCSQAQALLGHAVSSDDLTSWWSGVDAGEMVMILDSCHSGAVPGKDFRPGPLGDPGFGQLSYDKGMQILSASQPAQTEQGEWVSGGEGRTLLVDALETVAATNPQHTLDEWLHDTEHQLPVIARQLYPSMKDENLQLPVLLDFARKTNIATAAVQ